MNKLFNKFDSKYKYNKTKVLRFETDFKDKFCETLQLHKKIILSFHQQTKKT